MRTEQVSTEQLKEYIHRILEANGLTVEQFVTLGSTDELAELSPNLDFAYKAVWPVVKDTVDAA